MSMECLPQERCLFVILPNQRSPLHGGVLIFQSPLVAVWIAIAEGAQKQQD